VGLAGVVGVKDSSGDLDYFRSVLALAQAERPDWSVFMGPEERLADAILLGAQGGVAGGAQMVPALFVSVYAAAMAGDLARLEPLQADVRRLGQIYAVGHHASAVVKGTKCALSLMGLCSDVMAEPLTKFHAPERARVREVLESLHIPVLHP
jgi:4-hydroxy-tetrahydrodipicolinate synthase